MSFSWSTAFDDPCDPRAVSLASEHLSSISASVYRSRDRFILDAARSSRVLDLGAGEHDIKYMSKPTWHHHEISLEAKECLGLDINQQLVDHANSKGYNFVCADITNPGVNLGTYDLIFAGDILEHVDNLGASLDFIRRHLSAGGKAIVTTPNPVACFLRWALSPSRLFEPCYPRKIYTPNLEHTCWITPSNMLELCNRSDLKLQSIVWPMGDLSKFSIIKRTRKMLVQKLWLHEFYFEEFMYVISLPD